MQLAESMARLVLVLLAAYSMSCGGKSPASPSPSAAGLAAPTNFGVTVTGPSQMLAVSFAFSWSPPTTGPVPTGYQVEFATSGIFGTLFRTQGTTGTFSFPLFHSRTGRWRVRALDGQTEGPPSNIVSYTFALPPAEGTLPAPEQLAPPDRSVFDLFPRTTTFSWTPVPGAAGYGLEIDHCQNSNPWCENGDLTDISWLEPRQAGTSFTLNFVGAQPGRWIVWALGADGRQGAKSPWRSFRYTQ